MPTAQTRDLWSLVLDQLYVDPNDLAEAIKDQVGRKPLDYRTRLLIRDGVEALNKHWGAARLQAWLSHCPVRDEVEAIRQEDLGPAGFPYLAEQVMEPTRPETIKQFLRELGAQVHRPVRLQIGGSAALILPGYLSRRTQDLDVVDEIPPEIRALRTSLNKLLQRYRLQLTHFQSHYLPKGWEQRLHSLEPFGQLQVYLVDVYDVFLSKLFSGREKDRDDLRMLLPQLEKETLVRRLRDTTGPLRADANLLRQAEENWSILYGETLPS
jgi:hypothetical protein